MRNPVTGTKRILAGLLLYGLIGGPGGPAIPGGSGGQVHAQEEEITLEMTTEAGTIEIVLDPARAPVTVANFMRYVDAGQYNGGVFHRTVTMDNQPNNDVKIEVIQGAVNPDYRDDSYPPNSGFDPISLERTSATGLKHVDGVISMARMGPDTATSGFFFCIGDQPELDFGGKRNPDRQGFAAFGRVTRGMDVIRKIQMSPRENQRLTPPVVITRVERKTR
ncbi:MAG: peptidylprolyl isomerase [Gemmatimonadetes bacterium]|nr:peptidylprolyl isomerase [Gemmatimonadota bacterium]MYD26738.1 peptidylprolyl isomerase [Gemmatimonadota bacterium]MYI99156.1 peptidylprolyl isomerase [Gemmatimonadota bacterium]